MDVIYGWNRLDTYVKKGLYTLYRRDPWEFDVKRSYAVLYIF